jgi:tripartite-type tricarboxylate transporter receptor subunit TctC
MDREVSMKKSCQECQPARLARRALIAGIGAAVVALGAMGLPAQTAAQEKWPSSPLTMVVPFKAGGSIDRLARFLAPALSKELGVDVHVQNRDGAGGQIGFTLVHTGPADGSQFVLAPEPYLSNTILKTNAPYKLEDFAVLAVQENDPVSVTVLKTSPYQNLNDLIDAIRAKPDTIRAGLSDSSAGDLQLNLIKARLGDLPYREVTYNGTEYRNALLGGHVDFMMSSSSGDLPMAEQVRVLAIASEEPFPGWEGVQSINAQLAKYNVSVPNIGVIRYVAFPAKFKQDHPDRWAILEKAYVAAVNSEEFKKNISDAGSQAVTRPDPLKDAQQLIEASFNAIKEYEALTK